MINVYIGWVRLGEKWKFFIFGYDLDYVLFGMYVELSIFFFGFFGFFI